ncbi:MAG: hypothetical protein R2695_06895 [Acidimicrobiales bacterium]
MRPLSTAAHNAGDVVVEEDRVEGFGPRASSVVVELVAMARKVYGREHDA